MTKRDFSIQQEDDDELRNSLMSNKYKYGSEIKGVISKMDRAVALIKREGQSNPQRLKKIEGDLHQITEAWQDRIFWEEIDPSKSDDDWHKEEKVRELKMKKLMTVAKSKFYMLKINFPKIFEAVEYEEADGSYELPPQQEQTEQVQEEEEVGDTRFEKLFGSKKQRELEEKVHMQRLSD